MKTKRSVNVLQIQHTIKTLKHVIVIMDSLDPTKLIDSNVYNNNLEVYQ